MSAGCCAHMNIGMGLRACINGRVPQWASDHNREGHWEYEQCVGRRVPE